jgi:hypothetical protein
MNLRIRPPSPLTGSGMPRRRDVLAWPLVMLSLPCVRAHAQGSPADNAAALARSVYDRPAGRDMTTLARMELVEKGRTPRVRVVVTYRRESDKRERATLIRFLEPKDISGVGLLSLARSDGSTDQSLYLPELDRVRKIASDRKGGRFVGSDLSFEDLQDRDPERDTHRTLGRETQGGVACDIVESIPKDGDDSVYAKRISWIDRETLLPMRVDYFENASAGASKRWAVDARKKVQGYWTITDSTMADLHQDSRTRLIIETARYDRKLPAKLFSARALGDEGFESEFRP